MSANDLLAIQPQDPHRYVTPLTEHNYNEWKFQMQARLMQSTISWLVVNEDMKKPDVSPLGSYNVHTISLLSWPAPLLPLLSNFGTPS